MYFMLFLISLMVAFHCSFSFQVHLGHKIASRSRMKMYGKGGAIPKSTDRVRVQLLDDVERIGYKDDIVKVSKEQWMNILLPRKASKVIEEWDTETIEKAAEVTSARKLAELRELAKAISDLSVLEIKENATRNLKLFAVVSAKRVMDILKQHLDKKQTDKMTVKAVGIADISVWKDDVQKYVGINFQTIGEIRSAGLYKVVLRLKATDELVPFQLRIIPEVLG